LIKKRTMAKDTESFLYLEQRHSRRRSTLKRGKIIFNNSHCVVECTVRDLSEEGARLELPCHLDLPEVVMLNIPGGPSRDCEIVWSSNTELGVRFLGATHQRETGCVRAPLLRRVQLIQSQLDIIQSHLNELRGDIEASIDG
jgi:hypothetical protein